MEPIPTDWIDKLFNCMELFYAERWTSFFNKPYLENMYKTIWKNGLHGLTYDQIKYQLQRCKRHSEQPFAQPPIVTEFFSYAKDWKEPLIDYHPKAQERGDPEIAKQYMAEIKRKLTVTS